MVLEVKWETDLLCWCLEWRATDDLRSPLLRLGLANVEPDLAPRVYLLTVLMPIWPQDRASAGHRVVGHDRVEHRIANLVADIRSAGRIDDRHGRIERRERNARLEFLCGALDRGGEAIGRQRRFHYPLGRRNRNCGRRQCAGGHLGVIATDRVVEHPLIAGIPIGRFEVGGSDAVRLGGRKAGQVRAE